MLEKCVLTVVQLNWNQRLGHKRTKLNSCHHIFASSTQLQNRSFHVVERMRTFSKCQKMKTARAKRAKIRSFIVKICKFVGFLLPSSSWLLKLPITACCTSRHSDKSFSLGSYSEIIDDIPCCGETFGTQRKEKHFPRCRVNSQPNNLTCVRR